MNVEELYFEIGEPTESRDRHCKTYVEKSVKDAVEDFQVKHGYASFSEAGRALWLIGLFHSADYKK